MECKIIKFQMINCTIEIDWKSLLTIFSTLCTKLQLVPHRERSLCHYKDLWLNDVQHLLQGLLRKVWILSVVERSVC